MRKVYVGLSALLLLAVLAQFYFAAVGAFARPQHDDSFTLQGDAYRGAEGLADRSDIDTAGANLLARFVHTQQTGGQWQAQLYYDGTYRNIPRQYGEHRDTADLDLQYRFPSFPHHDLTVGAGLDHFSQHLVALGRGTEGEDDLGAAKRFS